MKAALFGPDLSDGMAKERVFTDVLLPERLRRAIDRLNPKIPEQGRAPRWRSSLACPSWRQEGTR